MRARVGQTSWAPRRPRTISHPVQPCAGRADATGGGYGCEPGPDRLWSLGRYGHVRGVHAPGGAPFHRDAPYAAASPLLVVRHVADPLIAAPHHVVDEIIGVRNKFDA